MNFELPEHLLEIQRSVRQFCEEEVKPFARGWDEAGRPTPGLLQALRIPDRPVP